MSKLLIDEPPLQVLPSLAEKIGLNEAILLQQLHYWLQRSRNHEPDQRGQPRTWVWKTLDEWAQEMPFWSKSTIRRTIDSLHEEQLIISEKKRKEKGDMTTWYAINYDAPLFQEGIQDDQKASVQNEQVRRPERTDGGSKMNSSAPTHNAPAHSETTLKNTTESGTTRPRQDEAVQVYHNIVPRQANNVQKDYISTKVNDVDRWEEVVKEWVASGYNPGNVKGMLDVYEEGWRDESTGSIHSTPEDIRAEIR